MPDSPNNKVINLVIAFTQAVKKEQKEIENILQKTNKISYHRACKPLNQTALAIHQFNKIYSIQLSPSSYPIIFENLISNPPENLDQFIEKFKDNISQNIHCLTAEDLTKSKKVYKTTKIATILTTILLTINTFLTKDKISAGALNLVVPALIGTLSYAAWEWHQKTKENIEQSKTTNFTWDNFEDNEIKTLMDALTCLGKTMESRIDYPTPLISF